MKLCQKMIDGVDAKKADPVYLAYLGALQAVWANHVMSPVSKLRTFNTGKDNIEKAVKLSSDNIEIRSLRLSIQKNVPWFLGYYEKIEEDQEYIKTNKSKIKSTSLLQFVNRIDV